MNVIRRAVFAVATLTALAATPDERPELPALPEFAGTEPVPVVSVIDADTIRIPGDVVRLVGIDAPEEIAPHGRQSTLWAHNLLDGERVWLVDKPDEPRDAYNRRLCYVYRAPDGLCVNLEAVRQGYARAYRRFPHPDGRAYAAWENYAREHHKGVWRASAGD